jgi:membrane fusion protein, multidrug efflux system
MRSTLLLLLIVALFAFGCSSDEPTPAAKADTITTTQEAPPLPADVAKVATASTTASAPSVAETIDANTISATGEFVSPVRSELSPRLPGRVARMYVEEGSRVAKGQPIVELESEYLRLNLQAAQADAQRAKAAMDEASRDLERKKELIAKKAVPQATYDRSLGMFEQARAAHAGANAQAALLRQQIADSIVRSPVSGVIAEKRTEVGARLGDGGVAAVVVQLSPLKLRFAVPERYLGRIERGDSVVAKVDPYPGESFQGTISTVGGVIDPKTRTMFAEAEFANRDGRLRPGLFAKVEAKLD